MSRILLAAGLAVMFPGTVLAGQFEVLHRFRDVQPSIGNNLQVDTDGSVYGTHIVPRGERISKFLIFRIASDGTYRTISSDKLLVQGNLALFDHTLFGIGSVASGYKGERIPLAFSIGTDGSSYTVRHVFDGIAGDGDNPAGLVAMGPLGTLHGFYSNSTLYGLKQDGTFTVPAAPSDYQFYTIPESLVVDRSGMAISTHTWWISENDCSQDRIDIFGYAPRLGFRTLYRYPSNPVCADPVIAGTDRHGNIYGINDMGSVGSSTDTLLELRRSGETYTYVELYRVVRTSQIYINTLSVAPDGTLIGTDIDTDIAPADNASGHLFRFRHGRMTVLHSFSLAEPQAGKYPLPGIGPTIAADGGIYGLTEAGGDLSRCFGYGCGVVYRYTP